jgi:hypothetical protein
VIFTILSRFNLVIGLALLFKALMIFLKMLACARATTKDDDARNNFKNLENSICVNERI